MLDFLLNPLTYPFMVRGLIAAVMVGVVSALVGTHVVLRGMAFFGDSLAHAILPGVAVGYVLGNGDRGTVFVWSLAAAVVTSLAIGAISRGTKLREDTSIGIVFAGMFALGIALISAQRSYAVDLAHFLFGDVLGVSTADLWLTAITGGVVVIIMLALYKELMVMAFDPILAATMRLPTRLLENLLLILIAVTIVVALQTVGITLMVAMLITPAATAYLLTRRLPVMMGLAAGIAALSGVLGLYASFYINIASGPAIVLVCTGIFLLTWLGQRVRQGRA
ncbi:MAG: metal ABC transporter permease [Anaerolineales bacterium]|nr:metal ABC transporter permease [Anaerolineales bacterium]